MKNWQKYEVKKYMFEITKLGLLKFGDIFLPRLTLFNFKLNPDFYFFILIFHIYFVNGQLLFFARWSDTKAVQRVFGTNYIKLFYFLLLIRQILINKL